MESINNSLNMISTKLVKKKIKLKRKRGYKAGKLSFTRNWCRIEDGNVKHRICRSNNGRMKTWKLFARFDIKLPPLWPWEKLECNEDPTLRWAISGDDVWGIAYEDLERWISDCGNEIILKRLVNDL